MNAITHYIEHLRVPSRNIRSGLFLPKYDHQARCSAGSNPKHRDSLATNDNGARIVRHYHTHNNNQTYHIYVAGNLPPGVAGPEERPSGTQEGNDVLESTTDDTRAAPMLERMARPRQSLDRSRRTSSAPARLKVRVHNKLPQHVELMDGGWKGLSPPHPLPLAVKPTYNIKTQLDLRETTFPPSSPKCNVEIHPATTETRPAILAPGETSVSLHGRYLRSEADEDAPANPHALLDIDVHDLDVEGMFEQVQYKNIQHSEELQSQGGGECCRHKGGQTILPGEDGDSATRGLHGHSRLSCIQITAHQTERNVCCCERSLLQRDTKNGEHVDLIDMRKESVHDVRGVHCNWILVLKDHYTKLSYCEPIPRKRPIFVAEVLCRIFGLIGPLKILQSDNGKEFTAKEVIDAICELDEDIYAVFGRPRKPNDIGDNVYNRGLRQPEPWWDTTYIASFAQLYVHCQTPNKVMEEALTAPLNEKVRKAFSVVHAALHYAVLEIDVECQTILVWNGLSYDLTTWTSRMTNILKRTRLVHLEMQPVMQP
ncbi:hypothetical protein IV203_033827 [Nitzschia inconspicua]|uniref:Integrase catalytic domain-containing protein n=1 Tax=Nitzschia inconspicua TaxID=303405 RepID=A0A9K3M2J9_9STRA|nr:hypothetical protein IV203_033827 [Nitzschia inconspicua]